MGGSNSESRSTNTTTNQDNRSLSEQDGIALSSSDGFVAGARDRATSIIADGSEILIDQVPEEVIAALGEFVLEQNNQNLRLFETATAANGDLFSTAVDRSQPADSQNLKMALLASVAVVAVVAYMGSRK